jgi:hypothetical protein
MAIVNRPAQMVWYRRHLQQPRFHFRRWHEADDQECPLILSAGESKADNICLL